MIATLQRTKLFWLAIVAVALLLGFCNPPPTYSQTTAPTTQTSEGRAFVTPNTLGFAVIEHGLGVPPSGVVATGNSPSGGTPNIASQIVTDQFTARTFRVRVINPRGYAITVPVSISWIAFKVATGSANIAPAGTAAWKTYAGLLLRHRSSIIYVEDHTGYRWPVHEATLDWDYGTVASVRYGACRGNYGCIKVYEGNYGRNGQAAVTSWAWSGNYFVGPVIIRFNDAYAFSAHAYRQTACHELGHGVGITFHGPTSTCLYYAANIYASTNPGSWGRIWANRAYTW
jgi:hypothetical protein